MANCFLNMLNLVFQQDNSIGEKKKSLEKMVLCQFSIHKQKNESGTYSQIIHMDPWVLARVFQAAGRELYALSFPELAQKETLKTGRLYTA